MKASQLVTGMMLFAVLYFPMQVCAQTSPVVSPGAAQARTRTERASWDDRAKEVFGLDEEQFASMGLSKLTVAEYVQLSNWVDGLKTKVRLDSARIVQCGPTRSTPQEYGTVYVYVDVINTTPSELASSVRQSLRAIPDVRVVFSERESDLKINLGGFENTAGDSRRVTGYTVSATTMQSCVVALLSAPTTERDLLVYDSQYLTTGPPDAAGVASRLVSDIDGDAIETRRKILAARRQFIYQVPVR